MGVGIVKNVLLDSNNFETSSWDVGFVVTSDGCPAPDGSFTAFNIVDSSTGASGYAERRFPYPEISGRDVNLVFGTFIKLTGVNSKSGIKCRVNSSSQSYAIYQTESSNGNIFISCNAPSYRSVEAGSGWRLLEMTFPNSLYNSKIQTTIWAVDGLGNSTLGGVAIWNPYLTTEDNAVTLHSDLSPVHDDKKKQSDKLTPVGRRYQYRRGKRDMLSFETNYVSKTDRDIVNDWWEENTELLAFDEYGSFVMSCQIVNNSAPINEYTEPYPNLFGGTIKLGTY